MKTKLFTVLVGLLCCILNGQNLCASEYGLVGWWKFDETSGNTAYDSSINTNNGTLNGYPQWDPDGAVGGCLYFDGTGDCVLLANESYYDVYDYITVTAWVKVDSFDENYNTILRKGTSFWLARNSTTDTMYFNTTDTDCLTASRYTRGSIDVNDGQWHHVAGVFDGQSVKLYIDGILDTVTAASTTGICQNDTDLFIGSENAGSSRHWNGWLDDLRIYDRPLTAEEIKRIASNFLTEGELFGDVSASDYMQYMINIAEYPDVNEISAMTTISRFDMWQAGVYASIYDYNNTTDYAEAVAGFLVKFEELGSQSDIADQFYMGGYALCYAYDIVKNTGVLTTAQKNEIKAAFSGLATECANNKDSGGSMNRGAANLATIAWVKYLLPTDSNISIWNNLIITAYDNDLMVIKDTNEDSGNYGAFWLSNVLEYTNIAGENNDFLGDAYIQRVFERYRDEVAAIGFMPNYGDSAFNYNWGRWVAVFEKAGNYYNDGSYRWVANRIFNLTKSIETSVNYEPLFGLVQAMRFMDDSVVPILPEAGSVCLQERMSEDIPDKLILKSDYDMNQSYVMVNLFNGGQHGHQDGSAVVSYIDNSTLLLLDSGYDYGMEYNHNLLMVSDTADNWPRLSENIPLNTWQYASYSLRQIWTSVGESMIDLSSLNVSGISFRIDDLDSYNTTFDFYLDDIRLTKAGDTDYTIDNFENGIGSWAGSLSTDSKEGTYSLRNSVSFSNSLKDEIKWISAKNFPSDISNYEKIEFWWKVTEDNLSSYTPLLFCMHDTGDGVGRWNMTEIRSSRDSVVRELFDAKKVDIAAVDVEINDYLGGDILQYRDIMLANNKFLWVRDFVTFEEAMSRQLGPLWNAIEVKQSGDNYYKLAGRFGSKDVLLYFIPQSGFVVGASEDDSLDVPWCISQKTSDSFVADEQVRFNSILIPLEYTEDANSITEDINLLYDSNSGTSVGFICKDGIMAVGAINTDTATLIESDKLDFKGGRLYLEYSLSGTVMETVYFAASESKKVMLGEQTILDSDNYVDIEIDYGLPVSIGKIVSENASVIQIYCDSNASVYIDESLAASQSYNTTNSILTFSVPANTDAALTLK